MELEYVDDGHYETTISKKPKFIKNVWKTLLFIYSCVIQGLTVSVTLLDTPSLLLQDVYMFFVYLFACVILITLMVYLHINRRQTFEEATKDNFRSHKLAFSMCGEKVGLYLRFGLILIGLFALIYIILSNSQIMTYKVGCINTGLIISSSPMVLFFIIQAIFILKYHSIIILRHKRLIQFGLFNVILVNIVTWEISCLSKISYGGNLIVNDPNCTYKTLNGLNLYFLPSVAEYSVIGMAIIYEIAKRIGRKALIETGAEMGSVNFAERTNKAILGCIMAVLIVLFCTGYTAFIILADSVYHYKWVFYAHCSEECVLYLFSFIVLIILFSKTRQLKFSFTFLQNNIDKNLLYVSGFLSVIFSIMISTYSFSFLSNDIVLFRGITALLEIIQIGFQNIIIKDCFYRCSNTPEEHHKKPGQNFIAVLIGLNFGLWVFKSFQLKNGDIFFNKYQNTIQNNTLYSFFLYITLPMSVLYRYHSSCCFAGAFSKIYEGEADRFEGIMRVEGFSDNDLKRGIYQNQSSLPPQSPDSGFIQRSLTFPILCGFSISSEETKKEIPVPTTRRQTLKDFEIAKLRILSSQLSHTIVNQKLSPTFSTEQSTSPKEDTVSNCFNLLAMKRHKHAKRHSSNPLDLTTSLNHLFGSIPNSPNPTDETFENGPRNLYTRSEDNLNSDASEEKMGMTEISGM